MKIDSITFNISTSMPEKKAYVAGTIYDDKNKFWELEDSGNEPSKLVNAVEIDWNGADWDSVPASAPSTINTTSDLLKTIKYAANGEIVRILMFAESLRELYSSQRLAK